MPFISQFNWLDFVLILVFVFYAVEGMEAGFIDSLFDLASFVLSFALALRFYSAIGRLLLENFSIPQGFANAIGFFIVACFFQVVLNITLTKLLGFLTRTVSQQRNVVLESHIVGKLNYFLGIVPGLASAFVLLSFLIATFISFPLSPFMRQTIASSKVGSMLVAQTQGFERNINAVFGGAIHETLNFFTIEPESNETVSLKFTVAKSRVDESAEAEMLVMVNKERTSRGLGTLSIDTSLTRVAQNHADDMFKRGYFSHYTPEGLSPFDRMAQANISYSVAGENLALSANTELAMQGLINSPGHRANILSPDFHKIGIGVMDGGIYGEMFAQEFTD